MLLFPIFARLNYYEPIAMIRKMINERLPWDSILSKSRRNGHPWFDITTSILNKIASLKLTDEELSKEETLAVDTIEKISKVFDEVFDDTDKMDYYLKMYSRFSVYHSLVGIFVEEILQTPDYESEIVDALSRISQSIIVRSIRQSPYTIEMWRQMSGFMIEEARPVYEEILDKVEYAVMTITGNTVYSFFEDHYPKSEIDVLLSIAYKAVQVEEEQRQYTSRHGNGHSKTILHYVSLWQDNGRMKVIPRIMPFLVCLEAHWQHAFKLGCRQGVERMYAKQSMFA